MSNDTPEHRAPAPIIPDRVRDYAYPIITAAVALLAGYGIVGDTEAPLWVALAGAVLGTGTATAYRPSRTRDKTTAAGK